MQYKALIFGATGAVGRALVQELLQCEDYSVVTVIVRRKIEAWENNSSKKLKVILVKSLDFLTEGEGDHFQRMKKILPDIDTYHSVFICLGSRVKYGEEIFKKVEYEYVLKSLEISEQYQIPHFSFCSSNKANKDSKFLLWRIKGETEEELKKNRQQQKQQQQQQQQQQSIHDEKKNGEVTMKVKVSVFHPGLLLDRDNDQRWGESFSRWIPFAAKIRAQDVARAMFLVDLKFNKENENKKNGIRNWDSNGKKEEGEKDQESWYEVIENDEMLRIIKEK